LISSTAIGPVANLGEAHLGSSDSTGMGLVMECVADAMGWITRQEGRLICL